MHDPFADLVGLKPVVKPSVPIRNVGSSGGLSAAGAASNPCIDNVQRYYSTRATEDSACP